MGKQSLKSFTILEEVLGIGIILIVFLTILSLYFNIELLINLMGDFTKVIASVEKKMEEIKIKDFNNITNETFNIEGFSSDDAKGRVIVIDSNDLKTVKIVACFRSKGKLIGKESIDNCINSPIEVVTQIAKFNN